MNKKQCTVRMIMPAIMILLFLYFFRINTGILKAADSMPDLSRYGLVRADVDKDINIYSRYMIRFTCNNNLLTADTYGLKNSQKDIVDERQLWSFYKNPDGSYSIYTKLYERYLIYDSSMSSGFNSSNLTEGTYEEGVDNWYIYADTSGNYYLISAKYPDKLICTGKSDGNMYIGGYSNLSEGAFKFERFADPFNFKVKISDNKLIFSWNAVEGVTSYEIYGSDIYTIHFMKEDTSFISSENGILRYSVPISDYEQGMYYFLLKTNSKGSYGLYSDVFALTSESDNGNNIPTNSDKNDNTDQSGNSGSQSNNSSGQSVNIALEATAIPTAQTVTGSKSESIIRDSIKPSLLYVTGLKSSPGKKKITLRWNSNKAADGYQIQYGTNKKYKGVIVRYISKNKKKITFKGLKKKKKYYIRIRAYKNEYYNGKYHTVYGKWCKIKQKTISYYK